MPKRTITAYTYCQRPQVDIGTAVYGHHNQCPGQAFIHHHDGSAVQCWCHTLREGYCLGSTRNHTFKTIACRDVMIEVMTSAM
jgi:sulfatase maturation enzyme AslB (radical SAM superfamily)